MRRTRRRLAAPGVRQQHASPGPRRRCSLCAIASTSSSSAFSRSSALRRTQARPSQGACSDAAGGSQPRHERGGCAARRPHAPPACSGCSGSPHQRIIVEQAAAAAAAQLYRQSSTAERLGRPGVRGAAPGSATQARRPPGTLRSGDACADAWRSALARCSGGAAGEASTAGSAARWCGAPPLTLLGRCMLMQRLSCGCGWVLMLRSRRGAETRLAVHAAVGARARRAAAAPSARNAAAAACGAAAGHDAARARW
jgi:hypothetical protein